MIKIIYVIIGIVILASLITGTNNESSVGEQENVNEEVTQAIDEEVIEEENSNEATEENLQEAENQTETEENEEQKDENNVTNQINEDNENNKSLQQPNNTDYSINKTNETSNTTDTNHDNTEENKEDNDTKTDEDHNKEENFEEDVIYVDIEEIRPIESIKSGNTQKKTENNLSHNKEEKNERTNNSQQTKEENEIKKKKITHLFFVEGKKAFEVQSTKENLPEIKKEENEITNGKEVIISSKEHVDEEIRVFTTLEKEANKEDIIIYWENENKYINSDIEYYDSNEDGLIERISWIVPHLSTQIFKIIIETQTNNSANTSHITIENIVIPNASEPQDNPIVFSFNVSYNKTEDLNCSLKLNETQVAQGFNITINSDLQNGAYEWNYSCYDLNNTLIRAYKSGQFKISESFSVTGFNNMYLLKRWDNTINNENTIQFSSNRASNVEYFIDRPHPLPHTNNFTSTSLAMDESIIEQRGIYRLYTYFDRLEEDYSLYNEFYATEIDMEHPTSADLGEQINLFLNIDARETSKNISGIKIDFGDSSEVNLDFYFTDFTQFIENIKHTYTEEGTFTITTSFYANGLLFQDISKQTITISSNEDTEDPIIDLISPNDEATIYDDTVTFKFEVSDNAKVDECNFSVYNASHNSDIWTYSESTKVYTERLSSPKHNEKIEVELIDFLDRGYAWEVECVDNSSNYNFEVNYLDVDLNGSESETIKAKGAEITADYERKSDVNRLIEIATDFIANEEYWSADEKDALNNLGLIEEVKYYKKRLLDIEQTLSKNINFISDTTLREKRRQESLDEIDFIQENLPVNFELKEKYEYIKNGNTFNWEEVVKSYLDETQTKVSSSVSNIAESNIELQERLTVSAVILKIEIENELETKEFILVNKEIKINNASTQKILEIIPNNLVSNNNKIDFITKSKNLSGGNIVEINVNDIENNKIQYIINENIDLKKLEETDTILFSETGGTKRLGNTISGFLVLGSNGEYEINNALFFIILILVAIVLVLWILSMIRRLGLKKDPNTYRVIELIGKIKDNLKENNTNDARENYKKIQEIYPNLSPKSRKGVIKNLKMAALAIDRKDIFGLVTEYRNAKKSSQEEEAKEIYEKVQKIYKRLPEKDRAKVISGLNIDNTSVNSEKKESSFY